MGGGPSGNRTTPPSILWILRVSVSENEFGGVFGALADLAEGLGGLVDELGVAGGDDGLEGLDAFGGADFFEDLAGLAAGFEVFFLEEGEGGVFGGGAEVAEGFGGGVGVVVAVGNHVGKGLDGVFMTDAAECLDDFVLVALVFLFEEAVEDGKVFFGGGSGEGAGGEHFGGVVVVVEEGHEDGKHFFGVGGEVGSEEALDGFGAGLVVIVFELGEEGIDFGIGEVG